MGQSKREVRRREEPQARHAAATTLTTATTMATATTTATRSRQQSKWKLRAQCGRSSPPKMVRASGGGVKLMVIGFWSGVQDHGRSTMTRYLGGIIGGKTIRSGFGRRCLPVCN